MEKLYGNMMGLGLTFAKTDIVALPDSFVFFALGSNDLLLFAPLPALLFAALPKDVGDNVGALVGCSIEK